MKLYISASKQYDIENTPYSIVDYGNRADVVYTDSLDPIDSFDNYRQAYDWIIDQDKPRKPATKSSQPSTKDPNEPVYVIYAKGTKRGTQALYRRHAGSAKYCNGADAERFKKSELSRYTTTGGKYEWVVKEVPY